MNQRCDVNLVLSPKCPDVSCIVSGLFFLLTVVSADFASAQPPRKSQLPQPVTSTQTVQEVEQLVQDSFLQAEQSVFVSAPREFLRPLIRANRAIAEKDIAQAVSLLGEVLTESTDEDYLVPVMGTEGLSISLRLRAQMTLGRLPAKDRQLYRLRYGVQAKQALEKAIQDGDFELVSQVMQRFFFTPAGYDAAMLLGHHHLDGGRPIAAANCFQRIVDSPEARAIHDPEVSVLLATCWMLGDAPDQATATLVKLRSNSPQNSITFLGKPVRLFDNAQDAASWLRKLVGESPLRQIQLVNQWVMVGGNPQRNARTGMGLPLLNPRWETPTLNNPDMEKLVKDYQRELVFLESAPIPAVQPLAIGNTIVMRSFDRMIGVDFETGKRVWVFPPWDFTTNFSAPDEPLKTRQVAKASLIERLWLDSVYGQASSDGKSIFVVPDPGFSREARNSGHTDDEPVVVRIYNELKAIDIAREGAFRWEVGGETGLDEPKLAKSFFLGPPLPLQDELFAVCQQENEIRLVVLNADTGRLNWSQTLGTTENSNVRLSDDRFRRLASVSPSFANGIVVCATGTGALTGVDLSTRSLLWGYQYTTPGRKAVQRISPGRKSNNDPLGGIWRDSSILISDGKVFFTPVEAQDLICVDLHNGYPAWKDGNAETAKFQRYDSLFLACVEQGLAILVGESSVRAVSVQKGKQVWETKIERHGKPSGRGYANNGCYFFPTTSQELLQVNLTTGKIVKSVRTDGVLGNLVCYRGDVISHGVDRLATFPQDEPNRRLVASAESKGELTAELLALKSQLEIQDGDLAGAIKAIQFAYQKDPKRAYENILLDLVIRIIEEDFANGSELAELYRPQLLDSRRFEFLAASVNGMMREHDLEGALGALFQLMNPVTDLKSLRLESIPLPAAKYDVSLNKYRVNRSTLGTTDPGRIIVRLDHWIASRINLIYKQSSADLKSKIEIEVVELTNRVEALGLDPVEHQTQLNVIPTKLIPARSRFKLARELAKVGESLRASKWIRSVLTDPDPSLAGAANAELARLLIAQDAISSANVYLQRLESRFSEINVTPNQTGKQFVDSIKEEVLTAVVDGHQVNWNNGKVKSTATELEPYIRSMVPCVVNLEDHDLREYEDYQYRFFGATGEIEILDANGKTAHRFFARKKIETLNTHYNATVAGRISIFNNIAVLDIATEVFAFDWLKLRNGENPILWNNAIRNGSPERSIPTISRQWGETLTTTMPRNSENRVYVGAPGLNGICYLENTQLTCVDPLTGDRLWQRSSILPRSVLYGDEDHVIVWNGKQRTADVYDITSGQFLKTTSLNAEVGGIWASRGCRILVSTVRNKRNTTAKPPLKTEQRFDEGELANESKTERVLGLYDLLTGQFVWRTVFPLKVRGCLVQRDRIAIIRLEGNLEMLNLQTGEVEFETELGLTNQERKLVTGIGIATRGNKYLVHLKRGETYNRIDLDSINVELKYLNYSDIMWVGHLVCLDSITGKSLWRKPVRFENFQLSQSQPANLPVYFLTRRVVKDDEFGSRGDYVNFVGISLETGELLINALQPNGYPNLASFRCEPNNQLVSVKFARTELFYKFSDPGDVPPRPVAHLTNNNSVPTIVSLKSRNSFDKQLIEREKIKSLRRARESQKLLPQKQAAEKEQLEKEKAGN